jgi:hypothetical protein
MSDNQILLTNTHQLNSVLQLESTSSFSVISKYLLNTVDIYNDNPDIGLDEFIFKGVRPSKVPRWGRTFGYVIVDATPDLSAFFMHADVLVHPTEVNY